jgi:outer membrane receptor for ferrienterochelin and colicin
VTAGAEFERQRLRQTSDATTSFGSFRDALDTTRLTAAYFVEALGEVGRRLALSAGARLEDNERFVGVTGGLERPGASRLPRVGSR